MTILFSDAVSKASTPPTAQFPNVTHVKFDGSSVVATFDGKPWTIAVVTSWRSGMIVYEVQPEAYAWFHGCPVGTHKPWTFFNLEARA